MPLSFRLQPGGILLVSWTRVRSAAHRSGAGVYPAIPRRQAVRGPNRTLAQLAGEPPTLCYPSISDAVFPYSPESRQLSFLKINHQRNQRLL
jgi:hypothetical protein